MIVCSADKASFRQDVMTNDIGGPWQHEEIILKFLNPEYKDITIPNAEDEELIVVAELIEPHQS